jgi:hypothetical protein
MTKKKHPAQRVSAGGAGKHNTLANNSGAGLPPKEQPDNDGLKLTRVYKLPRRYVAGCVCNDCGANVVKAGHYVMIAPQIWYDMFGLGWNDNLCLVHIEQRLGRRLSVAHGDFCAPPPPIKGYPPSNELLERFGIKKAKGGET